MSRVPYRDKVWGWRLIIHLNVSYIIIIIRIHARYQHKHRTTQRNAPLFSGMISTLAISTGHRQWRRRRRRQRRVSIIHSADNQKSWKHTFMRRVSSQRNSGKRDERETERPGGFVGCTSAGRKGRAGRARQAEMPRGWGERWRIPEIRMTSVELAPWCTTRRYALSYQ